jgi:hypothetical protein
LLASPVFVDVLDGAVIGIDERVYWAEQGVDAAGNTHGAIMWAAASGGPVETLQYTTQVPRAFATDDESLYFTTGCETPSDDSSAEVVEVTLPTAFSTTRVIASAASGGASALVSGAEYGEGYIFYGGPNGIAGSPVGTDRPVLIATTGFVQSIATSPPFVYFVDPTTRHLVESSPLIPADGGSSATIAEQLDAATALQSDSACVYWIDPLNDAVMMVRP